MSVSDARILLHFDIHEPIELTELTLSFGSLAKQYRKHLTDELRSQGKKVKDINDIKLYITKIENNCILAELAGAVDVLGTLVSVANYTEIFVKFIENVDKAIGFFRALSKRDVKSIKAEEIEYSKKQCEDVAQFLQVASKKGKLGLSVAEYSNETEDKKIRIKFEYKSDEVFEAQKGALLAQSILEEKSDADYKDVLMYFYQANIDKSKADGKTTERAIIKAISGKDLPIFIISEIDRDRVMSLKDDPKMNPFKASYRVDVNVETDRNNIPKFYRVVSIKEIIPGEDN